MYIGEKTITTGVHHNLINQNFYNNKEYLRLLNACTERVSRWVDHNDKLIGALYDARCTSYGARQIAYADCGVSTCIRKIQELGRYFYKVELRQQVTEALAEEYAKLPEFAKQAYSLSDYVENFISKFMDERKNEINRDISAHAYEEMRKILNRAFL